MPDRYEEHPALTTADLVDRIANKYGDSAFPTTNKQFIVILPIDTEVVRQANGYI